MQEIRSTLYSLQAACTGWAVSFPGGSVSLSLFQAAWLLMESSFQLGLSENGSQLTLLFTYS